MTTYIPNQAAAPSTERRSPDADDPLRARSALELRERVGQAGHPHVPPLRGDAHRVPGDPDERADALHGPGVEHEQVAPRTEGDDDQTAGDADLAGTARELPGLRLLGLRVDTRDGVAAATAQSASAP